MQIKVAVKRIKESEKNNKTTYNWLSFVLWKLWLEHKWNKLICNWLLKWFAFISWLFWFLVLRVLVFVILVAAKNTAKLCLDIILFYFFVLDVI